MKSCNNDNKFSSLPDDVLVDLAKSGNEHVFDILVSRYIPMIKSKASSFAQNGIDKDDLFQEGLLALLNATENFSKLGGAEFKTYALLCIERRMITVCKSATRQKRVNINSCVSLNNEITEKADTENVALLNNNPESMLIIKEDLEYKKKYIADNLSALEFKVLSLYIDGSNYNEIAKKLCITTKAVDNALQRIRKKLRTMIY